MEEKSQKAAPEKILSQDKNYSLTGYFNDGRKRIDIVLVLKDDGSDEIKKMRLNFLINVIQFGLEAEVESGKMLEHRNLIFVKLHAPDAVIEELGVYFNERSLFKDSHSEFINHIINVFRVSNERDLIKLVRYISKNTIPLPTSVIKTNNQNIHLICHANYSKQYPGPDNYSTLERSNIVYKILLQLPFGTYENYFGIKTLMDNGIIQDAFALHDGPYFFVPKQKLAHINARQVLFFEWLGVMNIWKMQPIHMIHEYFGKRISYYFAFYEYFNFMLIIPSIVGAFTTFSLYINSNSAEWYDSTITETCGNGTRIILHPECRSYTLCPVLLMTSYCDELKFLAIIDKETTRKFGIFVTIWGIFFLIPWRPIEKYLTWIWEVDKKYTKELVTTEYKEQEIETEKKKSAWLPNHTYLLKFLIYILTGACIGLWAFLMFRFSILIWHYPRWRRFHGSPKFYTHKVWESENIAIGAAIYTIIVFLLKSVFMGLSQKITDYENNITFLAYERSIALKMYAFSFIGTFFILITYTYIGSIFIHSPSLDITKVYHMMFGYGMMNSGLGSAFDDIYITLVVITTLEHVIFKFPGFLMKGESDYPIGFNRRVPCWEREYKLKPITEFFFHKRYNALVIQFALLTCYSMMFPMASLLLFIINIWDLRHAARQLLLEYRRPLLINTSGPGFWKYLIIITALYAPMSNTAIIFYQSITMVKQYFKISSPFIKSYTYNTEKHLTRVEAAKEEYNKMKTMLSKEGFSDTVTMRHLSDMQKVRVIPEMVAELRIRFILAMTLLGIAIGFFLSYIFPETSDSLENAIKKEQRIKNKYQAQRTIHK